MVTISDEQQKVISDYIYNIILGIKDTFRLPTHTTLLSTFKFSLLLLICSIISTVLRFYTFISWQGALACCVILGILLFMERSENEELMQTYQMAKNHIEAAQQKMRNLNMKLKKK